MNKLMRFLLGDRKKVLRRRKVSTGGWMRFQLAKMTKMNQGLISEAVGK